MTPRSRQRRERKGQIVSFMERCGGEVALASITAHFGWENTETGLLMVDLKRGRVVEQHGSGKAAVWRLTETETAY
ncbi:MAG: hypothetical protein GWN93_06700 [Deltaproteobacteria bacterium]|nr:hypothetical protein [Deltaproteobacteria bacterium]